jgi:hypothetical protein
MNPKKKSRRYRASVSIQALDLAISHFTNSLVHTVWYSTMFSHQNPGSGLDPEPDPDRYSTNKAGSGINESGVETRSATLN